MKKSIFAAIVALFTMAVPARGQIRQIYSFEYDYRRALVIKGGINASFGGIPPMTLQVSWSPFFFRKTSFGLDLLTYPLKGEERWFGVGAKCIYFYGSNIMTELFFGGLGVNTLRDITWETKRLVITPVIEFSLPLENWRIGSQLNILFGFWQYDGKSWGMWRRWYDFNFFISKKFGDG